MFDFMKMLGGGGEGGGMFGGGIMNMLMSQLKSPATIKMINEKMIEMADFLASQLKCDRSEIGLFLKIEKVPVKNPDGQILIGEGGVTQTEDKPIVYVYVGGEPKQQIAIDEFIEMMVREQGK